jgi:glycosyltransferase involved in cell wall biosynthesis
VHYPETEELMKKVSCCLPQRYKFDFIGKTLGPIRDMIVCSEEMAHTLRTSSFTWIWKPGGEGYGHILHNSFAVGTPVIISISQYKDYIGADLLTDGETCIDLDGRSAKEIAEKIKYFTDTPGEMRKMRERVYQRFTEVVNFDREFTQIQKFLGELQ